jgi:hypothetical protein
MPGTNGKMGIGVRSTAFGWSQAASSVADLDFVQAARQNQPTERPSSRQDPNDYQNC